MAIKIGRLNCFVSFQQRSAAKDSYGHEVVDSWTTLCDAWAEVKAVSGREKMRSGAIGMSMTHTVATHYRQDLDVPIVSGGWRIKYGNRLLNIASSVNFDEENQWLIFECQEGSINGQ